MTRRKEGQFYIISAVIMCLILLLISHFVYQALLAQTRTRISLKYEIDNLRTFFEDVVSYAVTNASAPTSEPPSNVVRSLESAMEFARGKLLERGVHSSFEWSVVAMRVGVEVKIIRMSVSSHVSGGKIEEVTVNVTNEGYGGKFYGILEVFNGSWQVNSTEVPENCTSSLNFTDLNTTEVNVILKCGHSPSNYTMLNLSVNTTSTTNNSAVIMMVINGALLDTKGLDGILNISFCNVSVLQPKTFVLVNGTGYPDNARETNISLPVGGGEEKSFADVVNESFGAAEPVVWIINVTAMGNCSAIVRYKRSSAAKEMCIELETQTTVKTRGTSAMASVNMSLRSEDYVASIPIRIEKSVKY